MPEASLTLTLTTPIVGKDGAKFTEIVLREPRAGEIERSLAVPDAQGIDIDMKLISLVAGVPMSVVEELPVSTHQAATAYLNSFGGDDADVSEEDMLVIELDEPIKGKDGGKYTEITLREPRIGEIRKSRRKNANAMKQDLLLIECVSGLHDFVINELPYRTYRQASAYLNRFIIAGLPTTND